MHGRMHCTWTGLGMPGMLPVCLYEYVGPYKVQTCGKHSRRAQSGARRGVRQFHNTHTDITTGPEISLGVPLPTLASIEFPVAMGSGPSSYNVTSVCPPQNTDGFRFPHIARAPPR